MIKHIVTINRKGAPPTRNQTKIKRERSCVAQFRTFTLQNIWHYGSRGGGTADATSVAPCAETAPLTYTTHIFFSYPALLTIIIISTLIISHPTRDVKISEHNLPRGQIATSNRVSWARGTALISTTRLSCFQSSKVENLHCNCYPTHSEVDYLDHVRYYSFINENI